MHNRQILTLELKRIMTCLQRIGLCFSMFSTVCSLFFNLLASASKLFRINLKLSHFSFQLNASGENADDTVTLALAIELDMTTSYFIKLFHIIVDPFVSDS